MLIFQSLVVYFKNSKGFEKSYSTKLDNILGVITHVSIQNNCFLLVYPKFSKSNQLFAKKYYRNDRERNGTFIGMYEALWLIMN